MLIVCPNCATSYTIEPASLGPAGRSVRCSRCKESWFAGAPAEAVSDFAADVIAEAEARDTSPPQDHMASPAADDFGQESDRPAASISDDGAFIAEPDLTQPQLPAEYAPPLVPPMVEPQTAEAGRDDIETFVARRTRMQVRRKQKRRSSKWAVIILVLLGFNIALVVARAQVVRYFPQTASLYEMVGLGVNLRHLTFEDVKISREENDGIQVLAVEGTIVSQSGNPVEVPRLRFAVRNATGQEIYAWTSRPSRSILEPGQKLPFRSRLASPPADSSDVLVRFANANDTTAEK